MRAKDLIEILQQLPPETEVLRYDDEPMGYFPIESAALQVVARRKDWPHEPPILDAARPEGEAPIRALLLGGDPTLHDGDTWFPQPGKLQHFG